MNKDKALAIIRGYIPKSKRGKRRAIARMKAATRELHCAVPSFENGWDVVDGAKIIATFETETEALTLSRSKRNWKMRPVSWRDRF